MSTTGCTGCLQGCGYCTQIGLQQYSQSDYYKRQHTAQSPQPDRLTAGANAIRARIKEERVLYTHYLTHIDQMRAQEDLHGGWDAFANASEVSNRIDGLMFALEALGETP